MHLKKGYPAYHLMKVKEAKEEIEKMENLYDNLKKLQDLALSNNTDLVDLVRRVEEESNINMSLSTLTAEGSKYIRKEISRIQYIVENTDVKVY